MKAADLRKSILQAAVQGKLVPQDKNDEPAYELLKRIQAEKAALIKDGKLKKEKPLSSITADEIPYDLPDGWAWCRLGFLGSVRGGKRIPKGKSFSRFPTEHVYIRVTDMKNGTIIKNDVHYIDDEVFNLISKYTIAQDDLYITIAGTIGACGIVPPEFDNMNFTENAAKITLYGAEKLYIIDAISSPLVQGQFSEKTNQMAQPKLALERIATTLIPLPPLAEQQRIVAKVDELMAMCDELEFAEKELDALERHFFDYLPKSILQAAVQGKLVPQDKNDEPASELLKRIQAEKATLAKAGKLKKEKPLPPITEDEIPYDLPDGWEWCRLGELCNYGSTQNAGPNDIPLGSWILELDDIEKDTGRIITKKTSAERKPQSTKHVFKSGNLLYSKLRPYLNKVLIADADGYSTSEILPLHFPEVISVDYMLRFFRSPAFVQYANKCSYGVKMPRLGTNDGKMALVPLPPLAEQQRIVAKLDELMSMCDELKRVVEQPINHDNVIPFPAVPKENIEPIAMAARGEVEGMSDQAKQAIEDLFGEDE